MPDPADGGVGSPPFPVNLTAEERAHMEPFDVLDFEVFSRTAISFSTSGAGSGWSMLKCEARRS